MTIATGSPSESKSSGFLSSFRFFWSLFMSIGFALFFGSCFATMNFAIVCMVNSTEMVDDMNHSVHSCRPNDTDNQDYGGTFLWSKAEISNVLASYYWAAPFALIGFAYIIPRLGLRVVYLGCGALASIATLATPLAATYGGSAGAIVVRFLTGSLAGVNRALIVGFCANWAPKDEVATMMSIIGNTVVLGTLVTQPIAGLLCKNLGWQYVFYIFGGASAVMLIPSFFLVTSFPESNRFVSEKEKSYIVNHRRSGKTKSTSNVPWRILLTSPVVLGTLVSFFANRFSIQFFGIFGPTYMKQALGVSVTSNGIYSALPYLAQMVGRYITGFAVDQMKFLSTTVRLKAFNTIGSIAGGAFFIGLCMIPCDQVSLSVTMLTLQYFVTSLVNGGSISAVVFFAPSCSSQVQLIFSFCLFTGNAIIPYVTNAVTTAGSKPEWDSLFYFLAALNFAGAATFLFWGSGEAQKSFDLKSNCVEAPPLPEKERDNKNTHIVIEDNQLTEKY